MVVRGSLLYRAGKDLDQSNASRFGPAAETTGHSLDDTSRDWWGREPERGKWP